jgi:hypothetical protein
MPTQLGRMKMEKDVTCYHQDTIARGIGIAMPKNRFPDLAFDYGFLDVFDLFFLKHNTPL